MSDQTPSAAALPVTAEQRTLFLHHARYQGDPSLNGPFVYEINGSVDPERLRAAAQRVLRASRAMNMTFRAVDGTVTGYDNRDRNYRVALEHLGDDPAENAARVARYVAERVDTPMPPDVWPLYEVRVWAGAGRTYLAIVFSHLVCDAASLWLLFDLIALAYHDPAGFAGREPALADVPGTVVERVPVTPEAVAFFRERLVGLPPETDSGPLAVDRDRVGALPGRMLVRTCPAALTGRLRAMLASTGLSPFSCFLAAHLVLLSRFTGTDHVVTALPLGNRHGVRARRTLGHFVNTLPLGIDLGRYHTFAELCRDLAQITMRLLRFQDFDLPAEIRKIADPGQRVVTTTNTAFTYYKQPLGFTLPGCVVNRLPVERSFVKFPLSLSVENDAEDLTLIADVAAPLTASGPLDCFQHLLEQVAADPEIKLDDLRLLPPAAPNAAVLRGGDLGETPRSLDRWFDEVANAHPDRIALCDGNGRSLTYATLAGQVDHAARWLAANVSAANIAVTGPRDVDLVIATLAIVKAGKAFVPIDPDAPPVRVQRIVSQFAELPVLLTGTVLAGTAPATPAPGGRLDDVACLLFTSGTTGVPKGAQLPHRAWVGLVSAARRLIGLRADDTWLFLHSPAFDMAVWEMFGALLTGARLVMVPAEVTRSPADLARTVIDAGTTVLMMTPTAFGQLLAQFSGADAASLAVRLLFLGGEALRFATLRDWFLLREGACRGYNLYGPTETAAWVICHEITEADVVRDEVSVIGRPRADVTAAVVDRHCHPLPVGVTGELVIGGGSLGLGYLNAPRATAAAFVTAPDTGARIYRTGDRVTLRPDGLLTFHGRADNQVKLRGYRIDLGEVVHALLTLPAVRDAVIRVVDADSGRPRLAAYLVTDDTVTDVALRAHLRARLPGYMVPSFFVRMSRLPLTINGKVDEAALPAPVSAAPVEDVPITDPLQARVRDIWRDVLDVPGIDLDDNFFDIGGTSMHVAEVHAKLSAELGAVDLAMVDLFQYTTVRALAGYLGTCARGDGPDGEPPSAPVRTVRTPSGPVRTRRTARAGARPDVRRSS